MSMRAPEPGIEPGQPLAVQWRSRTWHPIIELTAARARRSLGTCVPGSAGAITLYRRGAAAGRRPARRAALPSIPVIDWVTVHTETSQPRITF
jgi:hypothetical protein